MVGDLRQRMAQPGFAIGPVQLGRAGQRVDGDRPLGAGVGASDQVIAVADGDATQCLFGGLVVNLDDAVVAAAQQSRPQTV
jgi:hypothetical protein